MTVELAPEAREDDRELLIAMAKAFDAAWDRRDTDAFLTHFTPDADFGGVGGPIARGTRRAPAALRGLLSHIAPRLASRDPSPCLQVPYR